MPESVLSLSFTQTGYYPILFNELSDCLSIKGAVLMDYASRQAGFKLMEETIGLFNIKIVSNEYKETPGYQDTINSFYKIVFKVEEDEPEIYAMGILFCLALMSFTDAAPRVVSENYCLPGEDWNLGYFVDGLKYKYGAICYSSDYLCGRMMKIDIIFDKNGKVTLTTRNRGKSADKWLAFLQGKKHLQKLK
jgi:hypothetical protein